MLRRLELATVPSGHSMAQEKLQLHRQAGFFSSCVSTGNVVKFGTTLTNI